MTATATAPATPATPATPRVTRDASVGQLINEAGQAASTMLAKCKEAAAKAAAQLDPSKPLAARLDEVVALYAADFKAAGHNIRALFVDALVLEAAKVNPTPVHVVVRAIGKDGKMADQTMEAGEALNASKHAMRDAAKQVREQSGMARKAGGGRKASTPTTTPAAADPATDKTIKASEMDAFSAWLDNLEPYIKDSVYHTKIQARLIELGYTLGKAAPGRKIKGV